MNKCWRASLDSGHSDPGHRAVRAHQVDARVAIGAEVRDRPRGAPELVVVQHAILVLARLQVIVLEPHDAIAVRERSSTAALRQRIGQVADSPGLVRALDVPEEPVARLWHAATLLREHRGDGHNAALVAHRIGGTEAHVLMADDPYVLRGLASYQAIGWTPTRGALASWKPDQG